jgi:hypothetical protein
MAEDPAATVDSNTPQTIETAPTVSPPTTVISDPVTTGPIEVIGNPALMDMATRSLNPPDIEKR